MAEGSRAAALWHSAHPTLCAGLFGSRRLRKYIGDEVRLPSRRMQRYGADLGAGFEEPGAIGISMLLKF